MRNKQIHALKKFIFQWETWGRMGVRLQMNKYRAIGTVRREKRRNSGVDLTCHYFGWGHHGRSQLRRWCWNKAWRKWGWKLCGYLRSQAEEIARDGPKEASAGAKVTREREWDHRGQAPSEDFGFYSGGDAARMFEAVFSDFHVERLAECWEVDSGEGKLAECWGMTATWEKVMARTVLTQVEVGEMVGLRVNFWSSSWSLKQDLLNVLRNDGCFYLYTSVFQKTSRCLSVCWAIEISRYDKALDLKELLPLKGQLLPFRAVAPVQPSQPPCGVSCDSASHGLLITGILQPLLHRTIFPEP